MHLQVGVPQERGQTLELFPQRGKEPLQRGTRRRPRSVLGHTNPDQLTAPTSRASASPDETRDFALLTFTGVDSLIYRRLLTPKVTYQF